MLAGQTMSLIADLWKLQEIDVALDARRASLEDAQARLGETEDLLAVRARADETAAALTSARSLQREVEREADDIRAKIGPMETKLYSGSVRQPKELADIQADIDQLKRQLSAAEDRDLEALSSVESAESDARVAAAERDAQDAAWNEEQSALHERIEELRGEIAESEEQRRDQAEYVEPAELKMYDRLRAAHNGRALARLDRNLCLGCRISLPVNLVSKARSGSTLVQCPNCERILVA
ncbi:MAG TPA: C4-type zinc ribbon domain-containing protein [Dehalococcoidia bacterium]